MPNSGVDVQLLHYLNANRPVVVEDVSTITDVLANQNFAHEQADDITISRAGVDLDNATLSTPLQPNDTIYIAKGSVKSGR
tara:strand:+ start:5345 stop:5587 length:243 start_codon:yes stop_codon:yes gene_type:complete